MNNETRYRLFSGRSDKASDISNILFYTGALAFSYALKSHYSTAGPEDLLWILAPAAHLTELVFGIPFEFESGAGYVCLRHGVVIAPACAGVNFLIMCFSTAMFPFLHRLRDTRAKWFWFFGAVVGAYAFALGINAFRIFLSVRIFEAGFSGWLCDPRLFDHQEMHRIAGILTYLSALCVLYGTAGKINAALVRFFGRRRQTGERIDRSPRSGLFPNPAPFIVYLLLAIAVPLLNSGLKKQAPLFPEHCATVVSLCLVVFAAWSLARIAFRLKRHSG